MKHDHRERLAMAHATISAMARQQSITDVDIVKVKINGNGPGSRASAREFKLHELTMLSLTPILRGIQHWWLERAERHYLICADVEEERAREAQLNVAYYQKRAALARSARL